MAYKSRKLNFLLLLFVALLLKCPSLSWAQTGESAENVEHPELIQTLGNDYQNSILLLRNRFRIDHNVDEVTMIFFREFGSASVVLVRPDGSKIYSTQADGENVVWYDDDTYDMIKIKRPVPGPWQAVGQITPDSRVMVVSDIELHAQPLPNVIFSGEILKQTARLTNGGKPIDYAQFRDVVDLSITLKSTNNPNYDNFGAADELIATFEDNGRGMDEAPLDGVFTGQFNLAIPSGEWRPVFSVDTPMFSRQQVDPVLMLYPNPVTLNVLLDDGQSGYHDVIIDVVREQIDIYSLLIDGKVRFPNGDIQKFSITDPSEDARIHRVLSYEDGLFRVKVTAYATTVDGRDVILDVPEFTFLGEVASVEEEVAAPDDSDNMETLLAAELDSAPLVESTAPTEDEGMDDATLYLLIGTVNGTIVIVGLSIAGFVLWRRRKQPPVANGSDSHNDAVESMEKSGWFSRLLSPFKKKKSED
ncbi:TIGR03503 family protein [Aestuariibacter sp. A3R04]|uniref:TIGR03503 family protein n=1 Tax=Aestuariibacter sp. A3R04 TaxID=2841571 RepID=UPI001C093EF4|nr:TIGR03503 family protein [Aestuariibacter sp. A3R04]